MKILRELWTIVTHPKEYFAPPESPYVKADPEFRKDLRKVTSLPFLQMLKTRLDKRYALRIGSVGHAILVLTVALAATFTYFETVSNRLVSVEPWARPLFLPSLWFLMIAVLFLIKSITAPEDEVTPNPEYGDDEIKTAAKATVGDTNLEPFMGAEGEDASPVAHSVNLVHGDLTEVASRTNHDRVGLHAGRYYRNKALKWLAYSVVSFVIALTIYAVVSPILSFLS